MAKKRKSLEREVQEWFKQHVMYDGKPYLIDREQAIAVADDSLNTIVTARAGSGKTRTLVAKIVYLISRCGVKPEEIMAFVFNANAAREINGRLAKMEVDGAPVVEIDAKIASTFHAFSRHIVYDVCGGASSCKKILADKKEDFIRKVVEVEMKKAGREMTEATSMTTVRQVVNFINRAQQQFLNGQRSLTRSIESRLLEPDVSDDEREFIIMGKTIYNKYHWYLLEGKLADFWEYGTDFNLIVSWASRLIRSGRDEIREELMGKKYILIDEYQDFSQLFLAAVDAIRDVAVDARLFVVGDDFQAINRFAGSEVEYFKNFEKYFPDGVRRLSMSTNYRCDLEIVDTARRFLRRAMREKVEFRAHSKRVGRVEIVNPAETPMNPGRVEYDRRADIKDKMYKRLVKQRLGYSPKDSTLKYIKTVCRIVQQNKGREILILHRNNETSFEKIDLRVFGEIVKEALARIEEVDLTKFQKKIKIMTMHKAKGLEAEVVIILEADEGVIPKRHPDTELYTVFGETDEVALDDQVRLFYVAMTRAMRRLYIIHDPAFGVGFMKFLEKSQKSLKRGLIFGKKCDIMGEV